MDLVKLRDLFKEAVDVLDKILDFDEQNKGSSSDAEDLLGKFAVIMIKIQSMAE